MTVIRPGEIDGSTGPDPARGGRRVGVATRWLAADWLGPVGVPESAARELDDPWGQSRADGETGWVAAPVDVDLDVREVRRAGFERRSGHAAAVGQAHDTMVRPEHLALVGLDVVVSIAGDPAVFTIRGELDSYSAPGLRNVLHAVVDGGHRNVVLDLCAVEFLDAAGLGVLVGAARRPGSGDGSFALRSPSAAVRPVVALTGVDNVLPLEGTA